MNSKKSRGLHNSGEKGTDRVYGKGERLLEIHPGGAEIKKKVVGHVEKAYHMAYQFDSVPEWSKRV